MTASQESDRGTMDRRGTERRKDIYSATRYVGMQRRLDDRRQPQRKRLQSEARLARNTDTVPRD
ncbi:MAG: hypothetical protein C4532_06060 [Candidatus Abyssobacteria bacterium SURF_17]|uniref:Uncharacterized protein n=1 Tax=Candidatus Abyssobacteria bacterium SURF_17 TaxID=2093361 RepID=A0A419F2B1_9BACT|nr:MAG: hypothetical protein C4532_06060 [Candidatus Abyssubacteria bacterium SURF_17]